MIQRMTLYNRKYDILRKIQQYGRKKVQVAHAKATCYSEHRASIKMYMKNR